MEFRRVDPSEIIRVTYVQLNPPDVNHIQDISREIWSSWREYFTEEELNDSIKELWFTNIINSRPSILSKELPNTAHKWVSC